MTPEQQARVSIDALLQQAGWHVCSMADANIHATSGVDVVDHRLFLDHGVEAEVDANLKRAHALRRSCLASPFMPTKTQAIVS